MWDYCQDNILEISAKHELPPLIVVSSAIPKDNQELQAAEKAKSGEVYNVASGKETSINLIADLIHESKVNIPKRPAEPHITNADINKIKKKLGWKPKISMSRGIRLIFKNKYC